MSDFYGISIALSSLYAQRRAIEVTGNNIANANTDGYTRQRVALASRGGSVVPSVFTQVVGGNGSGGVDVAGVDRLRDSFLEIKAAQEHGLNEQLQTTKQVLGRMELTFNEPTPGWLRSSTTSGRDGRTSPTHPAINRRGPHCSSAPARSCRASTPRSRTWPRSGTPARRS